MLSYEKTFAIAVVVVVAVIAVVVDVVIVTVYTFVVVVVAAVVVDVAPFLPAERILLKPPKVSALAFSSESESSTNKNVACGCS